MSLNTFRMDPERILLLLSAMVLNSLIGVDMGSMTGALPDLLREKPFAISSLQTGMVSSAGMAGATFVATLLVLVPFFTSLLKERGAKKRAESSLDAGGAGTTMPAAAGGWRAREVEEDIIMTGGSVIAHRASTMNKRIGEGGSTPDDGPLEQTVGGAAEVLQTSKQRMGLAVMLFVAGRILSVSTLVSSAESLASARFISGVGVGLASSSAPQVSAAVCPPEFRGRAFAGQQVIMCSLVVCGSLAGRAMWHWRTILSLSIIPALIGGFGVVASYRTDLPTGAKEEDVPPPRTAGGLLTLILEPHGSPASQQGLVVRKALALSLAVVVLQHLTGHSASIFLMEVLLTGPGGFTSRASAADVAFGIALLKLVCCGIAYALLDRAGRRTLLILGGTGASISLAIALLGFSLRSPTLSVAALSFSTACFQSTFGPLGWLLPSELLPGSVKSQGLALVQIANFATLGTATFLWGSFVVQGRWGLICLAFQACGEAGLTRWVHARLPETMGKSLSEIQDELAGMRGDGHEKALQDMV